MDDSGQCENGRPKQDQYKSLHTQWMIPPHLMKDHHAITMKFLSILAERDAAIQEKNLAISEKKAALAERDMAIMHRDTAIAERNNALMERDNAIAALEYRESATVTGSTGNPRGTKHIHHPQHMHHLSHLNEAPYSFRDMNICEAIPISAAASEVVKPRRAKRVKEVKAVLSKKAVKQSKKGKRGSEDLNRQNHFVKPVEWKNEQCIGESEDLNKHESGEMEEARGSEKKAKKGATTASATKATTKKEMSSQTIIDEKSISSAMRARVGYFKDQADSLTLEGVRRVLEKDLSINKYALDAHKRFIKECLQECFDADSNENVSKSSGETGEEVINSTKEDTSDLSDKQPSDQTPKELGGKERVQESPGHGFLDGVDTVADGAEKTEGRPKEKAISEETVKNTIRKRASYFRTNSETITLVGVRRLLEEDLKLDKHALDPFRELIKEQLDNVLQISGDAEPANGVKSKKRKKVDLGGDSDSLDSVDEMEDEEVKQKKKRASKQKTPVSGGLKNRKGPSKETVKASNKRKKPAESMSEESDDVKDGRDLSDDGQSQTSSDKSVKKRSEASTQVYGKHVEHLRSVLRSCNMSIPPTVYKRVKQEPESKREACLIKELEDMLRKEGLSTNPSEKEIKAVRKQKERSKELEGIDLSNIVSSSRRRSTSSFVPPPKPKISSESDDDGEDDHEDTEDEDDGNEDDNADETDDEGPDDSNSAESNEDVEDDSD